MTFGNPRYEIKLLNLGNKIISISRGNLLQQGRVYKVAERQRTRTVLTALHKWSYNKQESRQLNYLNMHFYFVIEMCRIFLLISPIQ